MPGTVLGFFLIPGRAPHIRAEQDAEAQEDPKWKRMDGLGCALMLCSSSLDTSSAFRSWTELPLFITATLILFILALTDGNINVSI